MPLSDNINTFSDVRRVFDQALAHGGLRVKFDTPQAATHWRHRAYHFRKLLFKQAEASSIIPGQTAETPYDNLILQINENTVTVKPQELKGELFDLAGNPIKVDREEGEDELLSEAEAFKRSLKGDVD